MADAILKWLSSDAHIRATTGHSIQRPKRDDAYFAALDLSRQMQGVIHVAGTKGKGSTCAFVEVLLRSCGYTTGLFTSPHFYDVRERIRVGGALVDAETFTRAVLWCHDRLRRVESNDLPFPNYFTFLTLVALRIFADARLEAIVLEVGLGGRFDPTNAIHRPWVCGITSIGMDHMEVLGNTIEAIAFEKGGILKCAVPAYTFHQQPNAMATLESCADMAGTQLCQTSPHDYHNWQDVHGDGPLTGYQLTNAALAVHLAQEFERAYWQRQSHPSSSFVRRMACLEKGMLPQEYLHGLSQVEWTGRAQIVKKPHLPFADGGSCREAANVCFYLDGAHTEESLKACVDWIRPQWQKRDASTLDILFFQCQQPRDPHALLKSLHRELQEHQLMPHHTFFAPLWTQRMHLIPLAQGMPSLEWQERQLSAWSALAQNTPSPPFSLPCLGDVTVQMPSVKLKFPEGKADVFASLPAAMEWFGTVARQQPSSNIRILTTGSLYFVADVLALVRKRPPRL